MNDPVNMTLSDGCFMAVLGICIVFSGLVLLSLGICLSARLLAWWETRVKDGVVPYLRGALKREGLKGMSTGLAEQTLQDADATDVETSLRRLSDQLGDPFKLPELLRLADKYGIERPHWQVSQLLRNGSLSGGTDGLFHWQAVKK